MFKYITKNGDFIFIEIGKQDFETMTVEVQTQNKEVITCKMFHEEDGDYGFIYDDECIYFHHTVR